MYDLWFVTQSLSGEEVAYVISGKSSIRQSLCYYVAHREFVRDKGLYLDLIKVRILSLTSVRLGFVLKTSTVSIDPGLKSSPLEIRRYNIKLLLELCSP